MITVLHSGIDSLEASFKGTLERGLVEQLETLKKRAQEEKTLQAFPVGDLEFGVNPAGVKPWPYLLTHEDLYLRLSPVGDFPTVSVKPTALGLMAYGHESLYALGESLAYELGALQATGLSRLDICVDFQGHKPTLEEMSFAACRAEFHPIYPSIDNPETYYYGKRPLMVRVYDKTEEITRSGKEWVRAVWSQCPEYDPEEPVWRFELELGRETLRSLCCETAEEAFQNLPGLLSFGLAWCSPRVRTESNRSRCPVEPWWKELGEASMAGAALERVKQERRACSFKRLVPQALGLLVSGAAYANVKDLERAIDLQASELKSYIARKGIPFEERVRTRQLEVSR